MVLNEFISRFVKTDIKKEVTTSQASVRPNNEEISEELSQVISKSRLAQKTLEEYTQEQVDELIRAIVYSCCQKSVAEKIADLAVEESKLGNYEGKYAKMFSKTRAALHDIINDKSVGIIEEDIERNISKIAKPIGVIFAVVPCTNPEATPVIKAINAIKGRNSIIFSANSKTVYVNEFIVTQMRLALLKMGAPEDIIQAIEGPCRAKTKFMLENSDFNLVTGANSIVKAAYQSGTPSLGVGVGNAVIVVSLKPTETEEIKKAATCIAKSKTFDHAASCSADNSIVCFKPIASLLLGELKKNGGYVLENENDIVKIRDVLFDTSGLSAKFRKEAIVKSAQYIAKLAKVDVPENTTFLIIPRKCHQVGKSFPLSGEKLSPVVTFFTVNTIEEAIKLTNNIHEYQGQGHSCGIYSSNETEIVNYSLETKTARVMVNQPQSLSNSGNVWNGMRQTFSLGCGTWGGNSTTENINWKNLVNITYVSRPLKVPKQVPTDEELFGKAVMSLISE